ncbi:MAG: hypothetical protein IPH94_13465 [Saprospiraceae bacterium]|nr:hypothetical protein [Saprospiraceae bacterium]
MPLCPYHFYFRCGCKDSGKPSTAHRRPLTVDRQPLTVNGLPLTGNGSPAIVNGLPAPVPMQAKPPTAYRQPLIYLANAS